MKVQLLLLLVALAGPLCTFTRASPTSLPMEDDEAATGRPDTEVPEELTVITGATEMAPTMVAEVLMTPGPTEGPSTDDENTTEGGTVAEVDTQAPEASTQHAPESNPATAPPPVETAPPAAATEEAGAVATAAAEAKPKDDVVIEEGTDEASEGLSSGQVAGIVIGALLAVVIVIAVVIAAIRRMGKYSP